MTNKEAKSKACPFRQLPCPGCLGDGCAVWVWTTNSVINNHTGVSKTLPKDQWQGRCGLAK